MKRVVVLGGRGFLGSRVVSALRRVDGVEVAVASRRGQLQVDVTKPSTFEALRGTHLLVDLTDATTTKPDEVIAWCLDHGITVLEATSDAPCVERLYEQHRQRTHGQLILGGGIFTGVSNLLARSVAQSVEHPQSLTMGISTSPFSGAGTGTIALMVHSLGVAAVRYVQGVRHNIARVEAGPTLSFGPRQRPTVRASLAEPYMIYQSLKVPNVDVYFGPKPGLLAAMFARTPSVFFASTLGRWALTAYFTLLRKVLMRTVPTSVEMTATASGANGTQTQLVVAPDGMMAGAWALAVMVEHVLSLPNRAGTRFIDEVATLEATLHRANELAGSEVFAVPRV